MELDLWNFKCPLERSKQRRKAYTYRRAQVGLGFQGLSYVVGYLKEEELSEEGGKDCARQ